ncbi:MULTISPECIES: metallophosphoesterase family protein [Sphingomonas]|uniref:Metallophosphoesterase family protein n=1 Tax=Sphingomonas molluscorum TaxID=418184 RepID=A0ABU8Q7R6_9SPHN|nr:metallophosphoesterase family protein [Sphingomonas sp. JUb134]MBM7407128.1 serine/threonine protein phosphatase 1 [Sphingomonas sp. JUb134]
MMFFKRRKAELRTYQLPAGQRIYAIGDIHGRIDLLRQLLDRVEADLRARPVAGTVLLVFLGDLVDRGPDSAAVVALVRELVTAGRAVLIKGNHEEIFVQAARGEARAARGLLQIGGGATLASYGITQEEIDRGSFADLAELLVDRIPRADVDFLDRARDWYRSGDYLFVHAGIRPRVPLDEQDPSDFRWIRREFIDSAHDHAMMVVHGHTIASEVQEKPNRIGIDTGAYRSGVLTALGIEAGERWVLQTDVPVDA